MTTVTPPTPAANTHASARAHDANANGAQNDDVFGAMLADAAHEGAGGDAPATPDASGAPAEPSSAASSSESTSGTADATKADAANPDGTTLVIDWTSLGLPAQALDPTTTAASAAGATAMLGQTLATPVATTGRGLAPAPLGIGDARGASAPSRGFPTPGEARANPDAYAADTFAETLATHASQDGARATTEAQPGVDAFAPHEPLASLSSLAAPQATPGARIEQALAPLPTPGSPSFAPAVGERVTWLAEQGVQSAELVVTPPDLGPVQVRLSVEDGVVTVHFVSAVETTRDALRDALPELRDMLADSGLSLGQADVRDGTPQSSSGEADPRAARDATNTRESAQEAPAVRTPSRPLGPGARIDIFA